MSGRLLTAQPTVNLLDETKLLLIRHGEGGGGGGGGGIGGVDAETII